MMGGTGNACTSRPPTISVCMRHMSSKSLVLLVLVFAFAVVVRSRLMMAFAHIPSSLSLLLLLLLPSPSSSLQPPPPLEPLSSISPNGDETSLLAYLVRLVDRMLIPLILVVFFLCASTSPRSRVSERKPLRRRVTFWGRMWNDEKDFQLYLYLKLEELIRDGTIGLNAVNDYDRKREPPLANDDYKDGDDDDDRKEGKYREGEEEGHFSDCTSELSDEFLKWDEEFRRAQREAHEMVVLEAEAQLKEEREGEEIDEGETLNRQILTLVREGAQALAQSWTDFAAQAAADAKDDDIGTDLDYFAFLCCVPDAAKSKEAVSWTRCMATRIGRLPSTLTFRAAFAAIIDVSGVL